MLKGKKINRIAWRTNPKLSSGIEEFISYLEFKSNKKISYSRIARAIWMDIITDPKVREFAIRRIIKWL
jgi:hypothetical protein